MYLQVFDNFYNELEFNKIINESFSVEYNKTYQPYEEKFESRFDAYPCYENKINEKTDTYNIFLKNFNEKINLPILQLNLIYRKVLTSELKQSPFNNRSIGLIHQDKDTDIAGLIYLNNDSIRSGTSIHNSPNHLVPNIIIGAKPNRFVCYTASYFHSANNNFLNEERYAQIFFIKLKL